MERKFFSERKKDMYIGNRYLAGKRVEADALSMQPLRSAKIEEIFRRVKRRVEE